MEKEENDRSPGLMSNQPTSKQRALFLSRFDQTAHLIFINKRSMLHESIVWKFVSLAHAELRYGDTSPMQIYRELAKTWSAIKRRKRGWHGKIELALADLET